MENSPYDPEQMVFMDYRDYTNEKIRSLEAEYPTFLYAMPMTKTRVFFEVPSLFFCFNHFITKSLFAYLLAGVSLQETCLASKDVMPFDLLKKKLLLRLETLGIRILKTYEEVNLYKRTKVYLRLLSKQYKLLWLVHKKNRNGLTSQ